MDGTVVANVCLVIVGIAAAGGAIWQAASARGARQDAEQARDASAKSAEEANAALARQALAQEEANRIAKAASPQVQGRWWLIYMEKSKRWEFQNATASILHVLSIGAYPEDGTVHVLSTAPVDVPPGRELIFEHHPEKATRPIYTIWMTWRVGDEVEAETGTWSVGPGA